MSPADTIRLHVGCGARNFGPDWIHIDGSGKKDAKDGDGRIQGDFAHIRYHDIVNLSDYFEHGSVSIIYAAHTLEYFDRDEVGDLLRKWYEVLKPGGTLRLAVPDFGACARLYANAGVELSAFVGMMYGKWKVADDLCVYHKTIYDEKSLTSVLEEAGYVNVRPWDWRKVDHGHIDDYSQAYLPHLDKENGTLVSLNLECAKPKDPTSAKTTYF